jgi:hypothetical protein
MRDAICLFEARVSVGRTVFELQATNGPATCAVAVMCLGEVKSLLSTRNYNV